MMDLRHGRWQDVLADVECDALVSDPPYGERTHRGHDSGAANASANGQYTAKSGKVDSRMRARTPVGYGFMTGDDVARCVEHWAPRTRSWIAVMSCSDLARHWRDAFDAAGMLSFAPIPVVDKGSRVRLTGDGPSGWAVWLNVARHRTAALAKWGTLPGAYTRSPGDERSSHLGGKPLGVMRAIVRDYSRPGDLVCDPFAGGGTTLLAAAMEGRRAVGAEVDAEAYGVAIKRLAGGYTMDMFERGEAPGSETT